MTGEEYHYLTGHGAHDVGTLLERWRGLARSCDLSVHSLAERPELPVVAYGTAAYDPSAAWGGSDNVYICAGVHGDEPAGAWGLLEWAEANAARLRDLPAVIVPCLNPWGLLHNRRHDEEGRDLNRLFHREDIPVIRGWRDLVGETGFRLALHLHEDYDARGVYLYELSRIEEPIGERSLAAVETVIPREPRPEVDGSPFVNGLLRRGDDLRRVVEEDLGGGYPEAIWVFLKHAEAALTFETPSEFSLWRRVRAQHRFLDAALAAAGIW